MRQCNSVVAGVARGLAGPVCFSRVFIWKALWKLALSWMKLNCESVAFTNARMNAFTIMFTRQKYSTFSLRSPKIWTCSWTIVHWTCSGTTLPIGARCSNPHAGHVPEQFGTGVKSVHVYMVPSTETGWLNKVHDHITRQPMLTCSYCLASIHFESDGVATAWLSQYEFHPPFSWLVLHVLCHASFWRYCSWAERGHFLFCN